LNFWLNFVRVPLARMRGNEVRWVSGVPLFGSLLLAWFAAWHWSEPGWFWVSVAVAALDTGGIHWFLGMILWFEVIRPRLRGPAAPGAAPGPARDNGSGSP
jgi:hypothetical protein